jgi:pyrroloquinoline-quinone synthase
MNMTTFWSEFEARVSRFDLLKHPYYQAWTMGELTRADLRAYASQYYSHIAAFPHYLAELEERLPEGTLRAAIKENREDELGAMSKDGRSHSDLWLDFASGMGANEAEVKGTDLLPQIKNLVENFSEVARQGEVVEALAAFCAYESQVPRIAKEKAIGLKDRYGADAKTYKYFSVHTTADVEHTKVWHELIDSEVAGDAKKAQLALNAAEKAAQKLWEALDGVEAQRGKKCSEVHAC